MKRKLKHAQTGESSRSFIKHKVYGTVYAIEGDDAGTVLASAVVTDVLDTLCLDPTVTYPELPGSAARGTRR